MNPVTGERAADRGVGFALEFEGLSYRYAGSDSVTLDRIDLSVQPGEFIVLAGGSRTRLYPVS